MAGRSRTVWTRGLAAAALSLCATAAWAQQAAPQFKLDPNEPVDVHSDTSNYQQDNCTLVLTGNVQITQKQARLIGHTANAVAAKQTGNKCGDMDKIDVDKDVYYVTPDETVRADHALYDLTANKVTFTGQVVTVRGDDVATGTRLVVDLKTNVYNMDGPVHAVITPPPKTDAAKSDSGKNDSGKNDASKPAAATKTTPSPAKSGK
jgi:lipopolysaccharide export system protein LptA